jgi:predicted DNA-binding transcriptional regulator YafY
MRTYRVSRMRTVMLLAVSFQRPARFDLAKHWQRSVTELQGQRRSYEATLLLSPQAAESLIRWCVATPADAPIPEDAPAGWLAMHVDFESEEQALFVVLGLGVRARVLEPAALFDRVMGEAMVVAEVAQVTCPASGIPKKAEANHLLFRDVSVTTTDCAAAKHNVHRDAPIFR